MLLGVQRNGKELPGTRIAHFEPDLPPQWAVWAVCEFGVLLSGNSEDLGDATTTVSGLGELSVLRIHFNESTRVRVPNVPELQPIW